jgi:hypothetical protein
MSLLSRYLPADLAPEHNTKAYKTLLGLELVAGSYLVLKTVFLGKYYSEKNKLARDGLQL